MKLFRKVTITEQFSSDGTRSFQGISQSFLSDSGQLLSGEDAERLGSHFLRASRKTQKEHQSQFVLPCLEALRELIYAILAFPEPSNSDRDELLNLVFGPVDFDALSIEEPEFCNPVVPNLPDCQSERRGSSSPSVSDIMNKPRKILTVVFLILFTVTLLCFSWSDNGHWRLLSPFWVNPKDLGLYPASWTLGPAVYYGRDWMIMSFVWAWLGVMYGGFFLILKPSK